MDNKVLELLKNAIDDFEETNICVYGDNGSGKTTLLKEVHKALNNSIYIDSEDLIDEFERLGQADFREKYAKYDYLIIDNISLLTPRANLFNAIQNLNAKIISSSPVKLDIANTNIANLKTINL